MNISLTGRNVLICGSSQGIGAAIAVELAQLGANCILVARNEANLRAVKERLQQGAGQEHSTYALDFSNTQQVKEWITQLTAQKKIHILINNSGGPAAGPVISAEEDEFVKAFRQHLVTNQMLVKALWEGMKEEGYGRIINIISTSVKIPLKNLGVSNTIRGAVASWAKTMSNELAPYGITVNNILPGFATTGRLASLIKSTAQREGKSLEQVEKEMQAEVPAKRFGSPEEIAAVAAFLATPAASYVNGVSIQVDGGRVGSI
jgi:3-oxoacyl-[acyl-carrier protein] reductase